MISTRGVPTIITSDNALYFKLISEIVTKPYCIQNQIQWRFIPELAPWFGGFYERLVGLVKHCMKRSLQKHLLKDTQLMTVMKEMEAILNTRPLTTVDTEIEHVLTPADFLTAGRCITLVGSQENLLLEGTATKVDLVKSWRKARIVLEEFKEMFANQYLPSLRERYWNSPKEPRILSKELPKVGQIVQLKENKNREDWKVGKIVSLIRGSDGQCRIAKVKVGNSIFTRSITHLYPLEIEETYEEHGTPSLAEPLVMKDVDESTRAKDTSPVNIEMPLINENVESAERIKNNSQVINEIESHIDNAESTRDDSTVTNEINKSLEDQSDNRLLRTAKIEALKKIKEWTNELTNQYLFSSGGECRETSRNY
ncbi:uncharacterized protein LOC119188469 [Manduca sexta]|uniref:uncharacterized protein LOC119188469 n=1 Tax=Manduca sexta TaxID=7130 RepID=UPI00188EAB05|nr:uncharacterized protein LOC119188469 [Manduca sexta]XP_037294023.1 uncharacterized protein LOC119188469 [Manduca sexta]XP_037294024.1 uncharacterized protein LOC119188469 [Manduca sexta]XP_037294025.1 uncharacterized protein LOC119188469 [Manduca sexta]XP_037294026.1 uncharacterized protein LOC119188469 [Manduca sexta]XP_037294027.1 uncharacterized protein LOC119188469 [Manduca sexta]